MVTCLGGRPARMSARYLSEELLDDVEQLVEEYRRSQVAGVDGVPFPVLVRRSLLSRMPFKPGTALWPHAVEGVDEALEGR